MNRKMIMGGKDSSLIGSHVRELFGRFKAANAKQEF